MTSPWIRGGSFLYHSSKSLSLCSTKVVKVGASTRKAFALPCAALCVAQVWSQAIASHHELRRANYSALLGVVRLLVCSPAAYQQPARCFCALSTENTAGRPNAPGGRVHSFSFHRPS